MAQDIHAQVQNQEVYNEIQKRKEDIALMSKAYMEKLRELERDALWNGYVDLSDIPDRPEPDFTRPSVVSNPTPADVAAGDPHQLDAEFSTNAVTFKWFFDDNTGSDYREIDDGTTYGDTDTPELKIKSMSASTEGNYFCRAFTKDGRNRDSATAKVTLV